MLNVFFSRMNTTKVSNPRVGREVGEPSKFPLGSGNMSIYYYPSNIHTLMPSTGRLGWCFLWCVTIQYLIYIRVWSWFTKTFIFLTKRESIYPLFLTVHRWIDLFRKGNAFPMQWCQAFCKFVYKYIICI